MSYKHNIVWALTMCAPLGAAHANTCVGPAFDKPLANATSVETRYVDVPSPNFPGVWQEGFLDGFFYQIYANAEATIAQNRSNAEWAITVTCVGGICERVTTGTPIDSAGEIAGILEQCLLNSDASADSNSLGAEASVDTQNTQALNSVIRQPILGALEEDASAADLDQAPRADVAEAIEACGIAAVPAGSVGFTLQRLLVLAGVDPGPVDGVPGALTQRGVTDVLGERGVGLSTQDAITALDRLLCSAVE